MILLRAEWANNNLCLCSQPTDVMLETISAFLLTGISLLKSSFCLWHRAGMSVLHWCLFSFSSCSLLLTDAEQTGACPHKGARAEPALWKDQSWKTPEGFRGHQGNAGSPRPTAGRGAVLFPPLGLITMTENIEGQTVCKCSDWSQAAYLIALFTISPDNGTLAFNFF